VAQFAFATGQSIDDRPQRLGLCQLAKIIATNWLQQLKPLAQRSASQRRTSRSK
jgi:hypothetical protein